MYGWWSLFLSTVPWLLNIYASTDTLIVASVFKSLLFDVSTTNGASHFEGPQVWFVNKDACLPSTQRPLPLNEIRSVKGT